MLFLVPRDLTLLVYFLALGCFAFSLRSIEHKKRPVLGLLYTPSAVEKSSEDLTLTKKLPLHVRTHNLGLVSNFLNIVNDLRDPVERANEIAHSILQDPHQPDIIFFQEAFHEDAVHQLCEKIRIVYPYIIHSVAPQISGWSSGVMVASKYAIKEIEFERLEHMLGMEKIVPRGIIKVRLTAQIGELLLYGVHLQPLLGKYRSNIRFMQLKQIKTFMKEGLKKNPHAFQILVGDFNTSRVTEWGEDSMELFEKPVLDRFSKYFHDYFLEDHDEITGKRSSDSTATYLESDNIILEEKNLPEPVGSWQRGPFANKGYILEMICKVEGWVDASKTANLVAEVVLEENEWGTEKWHSSQATSPARLDYIVTPKKTKMLNPSGELKCKVEIRRGLVPLDAQSASSDHLPVDGRFWIKRVKVKI
ncbi:MAG: hypothetical protein H0W50_07270 [Parachlamydiaceae bacterium]|nr:hypothetical protein [Parachlamydiaceae bacterium]